MAWWGEWLYRDGFQDRVIPEATGQVSGQDRVDLTEKLRHHESRARDSEGRDLFPVSQADSVTVRPTSEHRDTSAPDTCQLSLPLHLVRFQKRLGTDRVVHERSDSILKVR